MPEPQTGEERTLPATRQRRQQVRREGRVVSSSEVGHLAVLTAGTAVLGLAGASLLARAGALLQTWLERAARPTLAVADLPALARTAFGDLCGLFGPIALLLVLMALAAHLLQTGGLVSGRRLALRPERLSPVAGLQRVASLRSLLELAKAGFKLVILAWIGCWTISQALPDLVALRLADPVAIPGMLISVATTLLLRVLVFLALVALVDYAFQRWEFERSIRMTPTELRQELKDTMGDPQIHRRIRTLRRDLSRRQQLRAAATADVIITNPHHIALALKYKPDMTAPSIVASGRGLTARRIEDLAGRHHIPLYEEPSLARQLFAAVRPGEPVPENFWTAVAQALRSVACLRRHTSESPILHREHGWHT